MPKRQNKKKAKPAKQIKKAKPEAKKEPVKTKQKSFTKPKVKKTPNNKVYWWDRVGIGKQKTYFVENLSMLMSSGMSIDIALESIRKEVRSKSMKKIISEISEDIEKGTSISESLEKSKILSDHTVALIKVGERSGRLQENLKLISEQQEKDRLFKARIRSAMIYPVLVIVVSFIAGIGISWFILPKIVGIFDMIDTDVPLLTKILIFIGELFVNYGVIFVPMSITLLTVLSFIFFINKKTKFIGQWMLFHIPITKKIILEIELARFGYLLGILLTAGLPIVDALDSIQESTTFYNYKKLFLHLRNRVNEGNTFLSCFREYPKSSKMVPGPIQHMIEAGEKSGTLAESLIKIGRIYEAKTEITTKSLTTVLEPILLIIIGLGVLALALAVITPIYGLIGNF